MSRIYFLLMGFVVWHGHAPAESGTIRGQAIDVTSNPIPGPAIRILPLNSNSRKYRSRGGVEGSFVIGNIEPGIYTVTVSAQGFRERFIHNVTVAAGGETDLGALHLDLAGCDAPGVICDSIVSLSATDTTVSVADIRVPVDCAVDADKGKVICGLAATKDHTSDFRLHRAADNHIYLEPQNRARLAEPNSVADCGSAVYPDRAAPINGLGPGSDLCVRTNRGRYSHLFFTEEVDFGNNAVAIHYVTRPR